MKGLIVLVILETLCIFFLILALFHAAKAVKRFIETHHYDMESDTKKRLPISALVTGLLEHIVENSKKQVNYSLLQKQAELAAMQNQIGPHFLYNTLDSIRGLALDENALQTTSVIEALSSMLRYSISQNGNFSTVQKELDNLKDYTDIMKYRLKVPFSIEIDESLDDEAIKSYIIPKLVFQPIVENAIYHGFDKSRENNSIYLSARCTDVHLILIIRDNGTGMDEEELIKYSRRLLESTGEIQNYQVDSGEKSIGLININQRIQLMFGSRYGLTVYSLKNFGTEVQIKLPIVPSEESLRFLGDGL
ncbi:sensor histidine kinase [Qiania dongpingensis]|uniref:Histidine kinase n=1 Tax=Qiania dongpingensis TaxID=2763669 RepID=A0A7G9G783_9FIRM|nr:histidine kinase [Qiania dongpingensis]QNM06665.1 histidine kinase [Qiania dongpingensis]